LCRKNGLMCNSHCHPNNYLHEQVKSELIFF
jgi:hypothetical protein